MFFILSYIKWDKIGSKAKFGGSVASVIPVEQQAMKLATRIIIIIRVRNHVVHA